MNKDRNLQSNFLWGLFILLLPIAALHLVACGGRTNGVGSVSLPPFNLYSSIAIADLDGDGKMDVATCYARIAGAPPHPGTVAIFLQDPANPGKFLSPATYAVGNDPVSIAVGDLNGDGKPDIVTANTVLSAAGVGTDSISVLLQDPSHPGQFLPAATYNSANTINSVAIGDINGDGRPDLVVADSHGISILLQSSSSPGTFVPGNSLSVPCCTASVAISDVNGDNHPDLIVANGVNVLVFLADPTTPGSFLPAASYSAGQQPIFVAVADLNGDGKPDVAVADLGSPSNGTTTGAHVLLQDPAAPGTFLPAVDYSTGSRSLMLAIADLNNDGKPDLAVANSGSLTSSGNVAPGSVSVFLQNASSPGAFQPAVNYPGTTDVIWVAIGDMNGDGKPDLVIADGGILIRFQDPANPGQFLPPVAIALQ